MLKPHLTRCQFSPTYLSTDLFSPMRSPFRETVPTTNIIAGGTFSNRSREDWGSSASDYGGIGKYSICDDRPKIPRKLSFPRSHRHYISGLSRVLHGVVQPQVVTSLLRSNCRQNDQFIVSPPLMKSFSTMREESRFVQEPSYSSHICRTKMFPLTTIEDYEVLQFPENIRPAPPPLSKKTTEALSKVVKNRYKVTSYEKDYENPLKENFENKKTKCEVRLPSSSSDEVEEVEKKLDKESHELSKTEVEAKRTPLTLKALARQALGSWPCWPAGSCYIVSTVTGQIVEKRDVLSLDDMRDFRVLRRRLAKEARMENGKNNEQEKVEANVSEEEYGSGDDGADENSLENFPESSKRNIFVSSKRDEICARYLKTAPKWRRDYKVTPGPTFAPKLPTRYTRVENSNKHGMTTEMLQTIRNEETLYLLLRSLMKKDEAEAKTSAPVPESYIYKMERREHPVLLPPEPLYKTLFYSGDRIADRLGVRYETVAMKRYHGIHPETVPDLRDFRPPVRKCKFLGYHTSMFR